MAEYSSGESVTVMRQHLDHLIDCINQQKSVLALCQATIDNDGIPNEHRRNAIRVAKRISEDVLHTLNDL